jgi:hypothetical protein
MRCEEQALHCSEGSDCAPKPVGLVQAVDFVIQTPSFGVINGEVDSLQVLSKQVIQRELRTRRVDVPKFFRWVTVIWFVGWRVASEGYNFRVHERPMERIEGSKLDPQRLG